MSHKYGAKPTTVDNIRFASMAEARRYGQLKLLQKAGEISALELQPKFPLVVAGVNVGTYIADFRYRMGQHVITEDVKGVRTPIYRLKAKLVKALYNVVIAEVAA